MTQPRLLGGRYELDGVVGRGGMAEVYRARLVGAEGFSRAVALKRVAPGLSEDPSFAAMFIAEARIAALLSHPNIVSVLDFDRDEEGVLFLAMELVDGPDLRKLTRAAADRGRRVDPRLAAFLAGEVLRGLAYAHELKLGERPLGIIHRDVSPHNVLVSRSGTVKLADFGIAKATAAATTSQSGTSGVVKGKLAYMAPEQALGEALDGRADVYALGVTLYELLAGERPYGGATEAETLAKILRGEATPIARLVPGLPADLAEMTMRLFAAKAKDRPASAAEALQALRATSAYPTDGEAALARLVKELFPSSTPPTAGAPRGVPATVQGSGLGAARSSAATAATSTLIRPSRRSLLILAGLAGLSASGAAVVWLLPAREPARPSAAAPAAASEVDLAAPPSPPAVEPALPDAAVGVAAPLGEATLLVDRKEERAPVKERAKAPADRPSTAEATREGTLTVRARSWAVVEVDGDAWGSTPISRRKIAGGRHRVVVENDAQGKHESRAIDVSSGENEVVSVDW